MKQQTDYKPFIYGGIALLAYFGVIRPLLKKIGVVKSGESVKVQNVENAPANKSPFNRDFYDYWKTHLPQTAKWTGISDTGIKIRYNKMMDDGFGYIYDSEEIIQGVFKTLKNKLMVGKFAKYVQDRTGLDLITVLKRGKSDVNPASGLNDSEIARIISIVDSLPFSDLMPNYQPY